MSSIQVRPFRRGDRDQLTALVNTHAAAVVPGLGISVSSMLSELERQPGEFLIDPWVSERLTGRRAARSHRRGGAPAPLRRRRAGESGLRQQRRHPLAAVLAGGTGRQPVLVGRDPGRGEADRGLPAAAGRLGGHQPVRGG